MKHEIHKSHVDLSSTSVGKPSDLLQIALQCRVNSNTLHATATHRRQGNVHATVEWKATGWDEAKAKRKTRGTEDIAWTET